MSLSKDTLKNLLDVMQKISLAITAVSIGLFSNVALSHRSVEKEAQHEMDELTRVRSDHELSKYSAINVIDQALTVERVYRPRNLKLTFAGDFPFSCNLIVFIPTVLYRPIDSGSPATAFGSIQTLEEMRKAWDAVALTTSFDVLGEPESVYVRIGGGSWSPEAQWISNTVRVYDHSRIPEVGIGAPTFLYQPASHRTSIAFEYDFSPVLNSLSDLNTLTLMRGLHVAENQRDLLKSTKLVVDVPTTRHDFSPALKFGPVLGKKRDFAEAFPNLDRLPDNYQTQRLSSLQTSLEEAIRKSEEEIEVFGAKIRSDFVPLFGLPMLVIFLFQFSAVAFYVSSNVERLETEEASQWSFLIRGSPFWVLSFGAIFVVPAAASILSFVSVPGETLLPKPISLLLAIVVVVCAAAAFFALQNLRLRVLRNPGVKRKR